MNDLSLLAIFGIAAALIYLHFSHAVDLQQMDD